MTGKTSQPQQISGQAGGGDRFHQLAIRHDHRVFRQVVGAVSHVDIHLKQIIGELMGKLVQQGEKGVGDVLLPLRQRRGGAESAA